MIKFGFLAMSAIASVTVFVQSAAAQPLDSNSAPRSAPSAQMESMLKTVRLYLKKIEGRWSASLVGDTNDPNTEHVEVSLLNKSVRVLTGKRQCMTKMKDRNEFGYLECNSAFYSVDAGPTAAMTVIRGALSLGILTAADAASGNTVFTVSLDQAALDAAISESNAVALARASAPLIAYRGEFLSATTPQELRNFITKFENGYDPESLVAKAKEKMPAATKKEEARAMQQAADAAQRAEALRQHESRQKAEAEALVTFRSRLQPGDRVILNVRSGPLLFGMVVEMKPPLVYVQWENTSPTMQWVRLDSLTPPRR